MVSPLVRLIILKKEGKGAIDFKLNECVVVASTALYYSSNIYVLLKYSREHRFDYSVAVETANVCSSEFFTSFCFQGHVTSLQSDGLRKGSTLAGTKSYE